MLKEAEEDSPENSKEKDDPESTGDTPAAPRKAKTKFGMKNKRKPKRKLNDSKNGEVSNFALYFSASPLVESFLIFVKKFFVATRAPRLL